MAFRLARMCGEINPYALLDKITPQLFQEWCVFWELEPEGEARIIDHLIKLGQIIAKVSGGVDLTEKQIRVRYGLDTEDLIREKQEAMLAKMKSFMGQHNQAKARRHKQGQLPPPKGRRTPTSRRLR